MTYEEWIQENKPVTPRGKCKETSEKMQATFPELVLRAGMYYCWSWGEQQHWWLETPEGKVIDPTKGQFPSKGTGLYKVLEEEERPIGKCMDCGELIYPGGFSYELCTEYCARKYVAYCSSAI